MIHVVRVKHTLRAFVAVILQQSHQQMSLMKNHSVKQQEQQLKEKKVTREGLINNHTFFCFLFFNSGGLWKQSCLQAPRLIIKQIGVYWYQNKID